MRNTIYRQMVFWIQTQRTWVEVVGADCYCEFLYFHNGRSRCFVSRSLVLRAYRHNGLCGKGKTWTVAERALDKGLASYRRQDPLFRQRIRRGASYLTPKDAEAIVRLATYGIVRLELIAVPQNINFNSYWL